MQPKALTSVEHRPNRVLVALAAAWMILSLAIGGAVHADTSSHTDSAPVVSGSVEG